MRGRHGRGGCGPVCGGGGLGGEVGAEGVVDAGGGGGAAGGGRGGGFGGEVCGGGWVGRGGDDAEGLGFFPGEGDVSLFFGVGGFGGRGGGGGGEGELTMIICEDVRVWGNWRVGWLLRS